MAIPENVAAKLGRTREHLRTVGDSVDAFLRTRPYQVERHVDQGGARQVYRLNRYDATPLEVALRVGDTVHNLRSSVDHLAVALARAGAAAAKASLSSQEEDKIQFPVTSMEGRFRDAITRGRLRYVDPAAVEAIRGLQPFRWGLNYVHDQLWNISELDNADKHRWLATSACFIRWAGMYTPPDVKPEVTFGQGRGLDEIAVTCMFPSPRPELDPGLEPQFSVSLDGALPLLKPIPQLLLRYVEYVERHVVGPLSDQFL